MDDDFFGPLVAAYTRAQALEDGTLIDLTEWASARTGFHGGFTVPVAVTRAVWAAIEAIPEQLEGIADVRGRAHDVLWMASLAARGAAKRGEWTRDFLVILPRRGERRQKVTLRVDIGTGDQAEPVVTIGFPSDF
jgi:hypothetical protein